MDLQAVALRDAKAEDTPVHVRAALMRAWCDLQERVNELRGRGKPKPVPASNDPSVRGLKRTPASEPIE
jgi:hypothetical protein